MGVRAAPESNRAPCLEALLKKKKREKRKEIKSMGKEKEKLEEKAAYAG